MTKSIIGLKIHCEKNTILTSWPLIAYNFVSDWPHTSFTPRVFLFSISFYIYDYDMYRYVCVSNKGAPIHHSAYWISVYQLVSCYIGIGKLLTDIR